MYKKILVPLDGSILAEKVLPHAQALAKSEGAELVLLRVPLPPSPEFLMRNPALGTTIIQDAESETETYLQKEVWAVWPIRLCTCRTSRSCSSIQTDLPIG